MWFLILGAGTLVVHRLPLPGPAGVHVPSWVPFGAYFVLASFLRLAIRDARLRPLRKRARAALVAGGPAPLGAADVGVGVGKGVAQVVLGGDFLGPVLSGMDLVARWLRHSSEARARRRVPAKIAETMTRERRKALFCILGVGLLCGAQGLVPDLVPLAAGQVLALAGVGF